ncbi:MAG: FAD-dependent oxidoreductase [Brevundimonas sp.]|nr:MAG: FAD-dependent oxidoreductase [Brevundimonas sp.]
MIVGAGVLGLCAAAELSGRGHAVTVLDPGGLNASAVAAGMIAPALESLTEGLPPRRAALLARARDLWPAFAAAHGLTLHREGADWRGADPAADLAALQALGFEARLSEGAVHVPEDWRIDVQPALDRLRGLAGVEVVRATAAAIRRRAEAWRIEAVDGRAWSAPILILATGVGSSLPGAPAAVAAQVEAILPIKGQLSGVEVAVSRVVRAAGVYVAPSGRGAVIGATMEPGARDLTPDPEVAARQVAAGLALIGAGPATFETRVGVRGAVADGLPLAGGAGEAGLYLALAPRRNGWLLGPMVGRVLADEIEGRAPLADAAALDPLRFV